MAHFSEQTDSPPPLRGVTWLMAVVGPGIVVAGSVMGSGELINTPVQAAKFGFVLLWAVLISCVIKYFLQVEIGRHALVHGRTTHEAFNALPGPKWRGTSYLGILYMSGYLVMTLTGPGIIGALAGMMHRELPLGSSVKSSVNCWGVLLVALALGLLWNGAYRNLEYLVALLVGAFSISVAIGVCLIQQTPYQISEEEIWTGLQFSFGDTPRLAGYAVVSLLGALGTTANELFMYPYWILEKGHTECLEAAEDLRQTERVRRCIWGIKVDVGISTALATIMTCAFFLLGCAILHRRGTVPEGLDVVETISQVYTESFGPWSRYVFLVGAFCTLFSTVVVIAAASGRMFADFFASLGMFERSDLNAMVRIHRIVQSLWLLIVLAVFLIVGDLPVQMIVFAQFFVAIFGMPLIMPAICWMAFRTDRRVRMKWPTAVMLVATSIVIAICTVWGLVNQLSGTATKDAAPRDVIERVQKAQD
jgi:Mn2+/Fe2+ NRAMP family transporter